MKPKIRNTRDRPGDAIHQMNPHRLSTAELLALLIDPPNAKGSALQLAEKILTSYNHRLSELANCPIDALIQVPGIGRARAGTLAAFAELCSRLQVEKASGKPTIKNSTEAATYLKRQFGDRTYDVFGVLCLNAADEIIEFQFASEGGLAGTTLDIQAVFKRVLLEGAVSIIACHNHLNGEATPRPRDLQLANALMVTAKPLHIKFWDYIIIGENGHYSFADHHRPNPQ